MSSPWLSVITVVRDESAPLGVTYRSLLTQCLIDVEWIVVVGCRELRSVLLNSLDPTDLKSSVIYQEPSGVYAAMNLGLEYARGSYVHFLNAGDVYASPSVLKSIRQVTRASSPAWLFGTLNFKLRNGQVRTAKSFDYGREVRKRFRRGRFPQQPATFYRREALLAAGGFREDLRIAADYALVLRIATCYQPLEIGIPIVLFSLDGLSANEWKTSLRESRQARIDQFQLRWISQQCDWVLSRPTYVRAAISRALRRL